MGKGKRRQHNQKSDKPNEESSQKLWTPLTRFKRFTSITHNEAQVKVKVVVNLKGRENEFRNIAIELIKRFQSDVGELATEETKSFRDRNIFRVMVPKKATLQKAQEPPKRKDKSAVDEVSAGVQHN
ncbi:Translation initiation factor IF3-2, chloroplastic [Glycine soja]|uniref:Translation initiation factor 3 C-terminal domain-containing protein n=2 Tax=Glycine subgen. Soja TaxID=1462606 RepID=K7KWQ0_SOYBN|nr:hypothetical protein JHK87_016059 [Glycine soja]KAH1127174.1 hypothetical protein GYH30_015946 [Glycine max]KHN42478.1 hypothetical protein glysoja_047701 [Glycine soja]RZC08770.1 Translation initiation factor IF3-2, chloroplastic [Glycine soja]